MKETNLDPYTSAVNDNRYFTRFHCKQHHVGDNGRKRTT